MIDKIREAVEHIFKEAPRTKNVQELKEELIGNLEAKYRDLIEVGKTEEEAYNIAVASIGDIDELISSMTANNPLNHEGVEAERKKTALVVSSAVGLYILGLVFFILINGLGGHRAMLGASVTFLVIVGAATCLLVYHFISRPKYIKADSTIVEEFKEWKQESGQRKQIYRSIISIMWSIIVVIYLISSFVFHSWFYSWIIFVIGAVIEKIIKLGFELYEMR